MSGSAPHGKVGLAGNLPSGIGRAGRKPRQQHVARSAAASSQAPERTSQARFDPSQYYEEIRHLGSGAFGAAVLVRRLRDGRRLVAKKCSVKEMAEKQRKMCLEEIALLQKVRHECVAQLVDVVWTSQDMLSYWIVLKFYPGGDVQKEIDDCRENELELPLGKAKNWVTQLCMALKHVHSLRIVHRDVKGSNMFITGARNIVLGDFGVSKQLTESQQKAMTSVGSPMYMAPEWWDGRGGTAASDMWSVGVVLYELLALRRPFEAQNVLSLVHKITTEEPPALDDDADQQLATLAMRLLQKRPESRPSASAALGLPGLDDVEKILGIYRGALEKKSDKQQRKKAREEDAASGKKPRRPSRSSSSELDSSGSGSMAGLRGINLADIARRQTGTSVPAVAEGPVETDDEEEEDEDVSLGSESSEEGLSASDEEVAQEPVVNESSDSLDSWRGGVHVAEPGDLQHPDSELTAWPAAVAGDGVELTSRSTAEGPEAAIANEQSSLAGTQLVASEQKQAPVLPAIPEQQSGALQIEAGTDFHFTPVRRGAADTLTYSQTVDTLTQQTTQSAAQENLLTDSLRSLQQTQGAAPREVTCFAPPAPGTAKGIRDEKVGEATALPAGGEPKVVKAERQVGEVTCFPSSQPDARKLQDGETIEEATCFPSTPALSTPSKDVHAKFGQHPARNLGGEAHQEPRQLAKDGSSGSESWTGARPLQASSDLDSSAGPGQPPVRSHAGCSSQPQHSETDQESHGSTMAPFVGRDG